MSSHCVSSLPLSLFVHTPLPAPCLSPQRGREKPSRPLGPQLEVTVLGVRGLQAALAAATAAASAGAHRGSSGGVQAGAGSGEGKSRPPDAYATINYGSVKRRTKVRAGLGLIAVALWRYGVMTLWRYGMMALWHDGTMAL